MTYLSHPDKLLEDHIHGVLNKTHKRTKLKIAHIAVLFHDLGKLNQNFQKKVTDKTKDEILGYSEHSYLSMYAFLSFLNANRTFIKNELDSSIIKIKQIIAIITKHHGNLPDFETILNEETLCRLENFLNTNPLLPISEFYETKLFQKHEKFEIIWNNNLLQKLSKFLNDDFINWQKNSLNNFLDTQFAFASLIEADKRDAGDNENYFIEENESRISCKLKSSLQILFNNLPHNTVLDQVRNEIRNEAITSIKQYLKENKRVFSLTAPTGSGKTFMLLALAAEIQKLDNQLTILYILPFLSITEQVEDICNRLIFDAPNDILSVNSKTVNEQIQKLQKDLETNQREENINKILEQDFISQTFDHPFIITTFVQFFETLVSNKNSTLLKLPNFSNRIFLIDEIQALPPRQYIFFAGWLDAFCRKNNSYAILSTGTMPNFTIKKKEFLNKDKPLKSADLLFKEFKEPYQLVDAKIFFHKEVFNRYRIKILETENLSLSELAVHVSSQNKSCLVILNTIQDTKDLYQFLKHIPNTYLLNTHFVPEDRRIKIEKVNNHLKKNEKVILISTQLIEAGVDIDFPVVYRDLCPLPSLIQSAGRCNRNNASAFGTVYLFHLKNNKGKSSAALVYRKEAKQFLEFCKTHIKNDTEEKDLFNIQQQFFKDVADNLSIGEVSSEFNMVECVNKAEFKKLGSFKLIEKETFGNEYQYYIPANKNDKEYEKAVAIMFRIIEAKEKGYQLARLHKIKLNEQLKALANRTITLRAFDNRNIPLPANNPEYFDIKVLSDLSLYSFDEGLNHSSIENSLL